MEPNFLGTPIVTSVLNSARETTVTVVVSTQESPASNMDELLNENKPGTSVPEHSSVSQVQTKNSECAMQQTGNRSHKMDASTAMGVLSSSLSVPPVQVPATPLKLQQLLTQSHQQSSSDNSPVVVQLPVSAPACGQSDPPTISLPSSLPSVLHSQGMSTQPVVVQVGHQSRQPANQTIGITGQRNQECHLLQPHTGLMPSVVVQVAKGTQKVVPTPVVTQSGARVLPILPLYLQPAGGGASGSLTAVMNPMPQVVTGGGGRAASRACGISSTSSSSQTMGGTSAAADAIVKKKKPIAPTPTHFLPLSLPLSLPLPLPMGTQNQQGQQRLGSCSDPTSTPHTTASATTTTFAYVGTIIEGASGRGSGVRTGEDGAVGIPPPGSKVLLAPSLSVLPHRGGANASGGITGSMASGARLLLPMGTTPQGQGASSTINLKISNGQIQTADGQSGLNILKETKPIVSGSEQMPNSQAKEASTVEIPATSIPFPAVTLGGQQAKHDRTARTIPAFIPSVVTTTSVPIIATITPPRTQPSSSSSPPTSPQGQNDIESSGEKRRRLSRDLDLSRCLQEAVDAIFATEENSSPPPPPPSPPAVLCSSSATTITTSTVTTTTTTTTSTSPSQKPPSPVQTVKAVQPKEESSTEVKETIKAETEVAVVKAENQTSKPVSTAENGGAKNVTIPETNLEEFDPLKVLEWRDGVGTLPGSNLKFRLNEFGIMEMIDDEITMVKNETASEEQTIKQESVGRPPNIPKKEPNEEVKKNGEDVAEDGGEAKVGSQQKVCHPKTPLSTGTNATLGDGGPLASGGDDIRCCEGCGCYGLASEFLSGRFCGKGCADQVAAMALAACRVREARLRQKKRRQKRREILRAAQIAMGTAIAAEPNQNTGSNGSGSEAPPLVIRNPPEVEVTKQQQQPSQGSLKHTPINSEEDNTSNDGPPSEVRSKVETGNSNVPINRVPWKVGKNGFSWTKYLDHCKAKAAPQYLFRDIYPCAKNGFKAGMKLEGIDPEHPSLFCVLTVAQVRGYRMRLHFDGYPDIHDFWTNADSPDLFPAGWCEKNGHRLQPPKGYIGSIVGSDGDGPCFNWATYLKQCRVQAAPRHLFAKKAYSICPTGFRIGMKLEAVDRKNKSLVCVATVADLLDSRILVHFDGWADVYDYWADPSSPYIHPVGWCKENGHPLTPPNGYGRPGPFSWEAYLSETGAVAAPARAFKQRPPSGFRSGMRLEAVDPRVPSLVRVATVDEVRGHRLRLRFDGWSWNQDYGFWTDDDSPDIHPVGWCLQTGHPLEAPITEEEAAAWPRLPDCCPTPGCRGLGNLRGAPYTSHISPSACPLTSKVLPPLPDRLDPSVLRLRHSGEEEEEGIAGEEAEREEEEEGESEDDEDEDEEEEDCKPPPPKIKREESPPTNNDWEERITERRPAKGLAVSMPRSPPSRQQQQPSGLPPPPPLRLGPAHLPGYGRGLARGSGPRLTPRHDGPGSNEARDVRRDVHRSVFSPGYLPNPDRLTPLCWDRHSRLLHPFVNGETLPGRDAHRWTKDEVVKFVENIPGCKERAKVFREEQIDGEAFLLLNQNDIVTLLGFKLGPAIKVYNSIVLLRQRLTA